MDDIKVSVWGDSVFKGIIYDGKSNKYKMTEGGPVGKIADKLGLDIKNYSRFGLTTKKAMELYDKEIETDTSNIVVFELGGNDCDFVWKDISQNPTNHHQPNTPLDSFISNIESMVVKAKQLNKQVLLSTLPPLYAKYYLNFITKDGLSKGNILSWLGDVEHIYRHHERYNLAVLMLAKKYGLPVIDIRDAFLQKKKYFKLLCRDGIHPNEDGQNLIFQTFLQFAESNYKKIDN